MTPAPSGDGPITSIPPATEAPFPVVGIGASAGGLEATTQLFQALPADLGMAFVLVSHLDPLHPSSLADLLGRATRMPVREVSDGTAVEPDHVYVIPPNTSLTIERGILRLAPRGHPVGPVMSVDHFFRSLAADRKAQAVGVILSGTGSDGTLGMQAVEAEGGITFAQDASAKYEGMPRSAVDAGCVDFVRPPDGIARELTRISRHPYVSHGGKAAPVARPEEEPEATLRPLFQALRKATGLDFTQYKSATVHRRIRRRMILRQLDRLSDYVAFARDDPGELRALSQDMLINVTNFFRDPESFEALKTVVFPDLLKDRDPANPVRVWVPGCASGEEVFSLAICLLEHLGDGAGGPPIKLFGTDVSDAAIEKARAGRYMENIAGDVSAERLRRYFALADGAYQINRSIRDMCVFARQDVTRDPPISTVDLVSCRNLLIYLTAAAQKRALPLFHYALREGGFLFLGGSETIGTFSDLFAAVDERHKIYRRRAAPNPLVFDFSVRELGSVEVPAARAGHQVPSQVEVQREADRLVLAQYGPPGVVVNDDMGILQFRGQTGEYLEPAPGVPSSNLLKMVREGLLHDLVAAVDEVRRSNAPVRREALMRAGERYRRVNLEVSPLTIPPARGPYFVVLFGAGPPSEAPVVEGVATPPTGTGEPAPEQRLIIQLRGELEATRGHLRSNIEKLETSNEELKAANEEIVSSNEELQSTNEELQSAKEELQATNEELTTVNDEMKRRNQEATRLTDDLLNLLGSVNVAIVMLGQDLRIRRFNPSAGKLFNLIPADAGRPIGDLKSPLLAQNLDALAAEVLESLSGRDREARHQDGRWYNLSVRPYRSQENKIDGVVVTAVDVDAIKRSEQQRGEAERRLRSILDTAAEGIVTIDEMGTVLSFNDAAERLFGYAAEDVIGRNVKMLMPSPDCDRHDSYLTNYLTTGVSKVIGTQRILIGRRKDGTTFTHKLALSEVREGDRRIFTGIMSDMTELERAQARALQSERLAAIGQVSAGLTHESRNALQRSQACLEMLAREVNGNPAAEDLIARAQSAQHHLIDLYEQVRSYAAPITLHPGRCDLGELLAEVWKVLDLDRQGREIRFGADPAGVDLRCEVDPANVSQVFRNLLENSLQACKDPAEIRVTWSETVLDGTPALRIAFGNNGPPLTPDERARVFDAFFTTKTHGTGLGMTIAKRIVEAHGGRIEVGPGPAAEFIVTLPRGRP